MQQMFSAIDHSIKLQYFYLNIFNKDEQEKPFLFLQTNNKTKISSFLQNQFLSRDLNNPLHRFLNILFY